MALTGQQIINGAKALAELKGADLLVGQLADAAGRQDALNRLVRDHLLPPPVHTRPPDLRSAAQLHPRYQTIGFTQRDSEMASLRDWCGDYGTRLSVRLITGDSGRGKTRLMVELAQALRDNGPTEPGHSRASWFAGFCDLKLLAAQTATDRPFDVLFGARGDMLIAVDYAENLTEAVADLLRAALRAHDAGRPGIIRIALLARSEAEVFERMINSNADLAARGLVTLHPDGLDPVPEPRRFYATACAALGVAEQARTYPEGLGDAPDFGLLSLAALLASRTDGAAPHDATEILDAVLAHEARYWNEAAEVRGLDAVLVRNGAITRAMAWITLFGLQGAIPDLGAAADLLAAQPDFADQTGATRRVMAQIAADLYPHPEGHVEGVMLDLLGDHLVARHGAVRATRPDAITPAQLASAMTRGAWIARRSTDAGRAVLAPLLTRFGTRAIATVVDIAPRAGGAIADLTAEWLRAQPDLPIPADLIDALPEHSVALRQLAADLTAARLAQRSDRGDRALLHNNLAVRLSDLGQHEAALEAAQQAVEMRRALAQQRPDAFAPDLAMALNNLAIRLSALGQHEAALEAAQQAVAQYRTLAQQRPDAFAPNLAMALNNLAIRLSDLGQHEAALEAAQQAVEMRRALAQQRPDAFAPNLAASLNNLAIRLSALGQHDEALDAAQEAVEMRRALAQQRPDAFAPNLAGSLHNLANRLSDLGQHEAALEAAQEAVEMRRALAQQRPDVFAANLARSLWVMGDLLHEGGDASGAWAAMDEAVRALAPQFLRLPMAHARLMAGVLQRWAECGAAAGQEPDAALLAPIRAAFDRLQSPDQPADAP